jgi:ADP-heptose:LPS heptosyltransferase
MFVKDNKIKELVFEKKDFRAYVICFFTQATPYFSVSSNSNVYERRKELIEKVYGKEINLSVYKFKILNPKIILINPLTRSEARNIKKDHLKNILEFLNLYGYEIYLIDIEKRYEDLKMNVKYYLTDTTLQDLRSLLLKSDFYIGGDSFLIHLAYYLKRNYFMIFYRDNDDFLPPNISCDFYIKAHTSDNFRKEIEEKFIKIGLINT